MTKFIEESLKELLRKEPLEEMLNKSLDCLIKGIPEVIHEGEISINYFML